MEISEDLFATKGMEYLLVIGFLVALTVFWRILNGSTAPQRISGAASRLLTASGAWFHLPELLYCHQGHTWARPEADDLVGVGIDDFAQRLLGRATSVELPPVGTDIEQGDHGWRLRFDSKAIDLLSPVNGKVVAVNEAVLRSPGLINQDPYGEGWLMKIRVPKLHANLKNLLSGTLSEAWLAQTVRDLQLRIAGNLGTLLQDGGVPVSGIAKQVSAERWDELAMEFLLTGKRHGSPEKERVA